MNDGPSEALTEAVACLWRMRAPEILRSKREFSWLSKTAQADYPSAHDGGGSVFDFALEGALRALGLPCQLSPRRSAAPLSAVEAARLLDGAFRATRCGRRHLVPLDEAGELPALTFGPIRLGKFSETDLRELVNATRLERVFPDLAFDARRLSMFQWLVVEEELALDPRPAARALPMLFEPMMDRDFGQIEPHKGRFPLALESALFALLLAPWETWAPGPDWRGFRTPWVYTVIEDIFVQPEPPPSADTLDWSVLKHYDGGGGSDEVEFPGELLSVTDAARCEFAAYMGARWPEAEGALSSPLFETPVAHFFVRAFLSEGIDEFLAHLTTVEAAMGLQADYVSKLRPKPNLRKNLKGATDRVAARIAALLEDSPAADIYRDLFDVRSCYLHGRRMEKAISSEKRKQARSLARRVVEALVARANEASTPISREEFLNGLLDRA